jgi:Na+-transporting NADH:ubiquinone oxidoreductase subunit C
MKKDSFIYAVVFTFITAFIFVFIINLAGKSTLERVETNNQLIRARSFLNAAGIDYSNTEEALDLYRKYFDKKQLKNGIYVSETPEEKILLKEFSGKGLWGTINGVLAMDSSAGRIIGLEIISHSETPGLGGRIEEQWFLNQFKNEKVPPDGIMIRKGEGSADTDSNNGIVDGITGASLTSRSMEIIVNNAVKSIRKEAQTNVGS